MSENILQYLIYWLDKDVKHQKTMCDGRDRFLYKCSECTICGNKLAVLVDKSNLDELTPEFHAALIRYDQAEDFPASSDDAQETREPNLCVTPDKCISRTAIFWIDFLSSFRE